MTVSWLVQAKCCTPLGTCKNPPGLTAWPLLSSTVSPIPMWNVPEMTVTFSSLGCVWRDLEARGELQADDVAALLAWVADED